MIEPKDKNAWGGLGAVSPEGLVFLIIGVVVGAIAAALNFSLRRRSD